MTALVLEHFHEFLHISQEYKKDYKTDHNCKTNLLRVYNDIVTTIGRGNGTMLVLLDSYAAFDTIDRNNMSEFVVML